MDKNFTNVKKLSTLLALVLITSGIYLNFSSAQASAATGSNSANQIDVLLAPCYEEPVNTQACLNGIAQAISLVRGLPTTLQGTTTATTPTITPTPTTTTTSTPAITTSSTTATTGVSYYYEVVYLPPSLNQNYAAGVDCSAIPGTHTNVVQAPSTVTSDPLTISETTPPTTAVPGVLEVTGIDSTRMLLKWRQANGVYLHAVCRGTNANQLSVVRTVGSYSGQMEAGTVCSVTCWNQYLDALPTAISVTTQVTTSTTTATGTQTTSPIYFSVGGPIAGARFIADRLSYLVTDTFNLSITGAPANAPVQICAVQKHNDGSLSNFGCTPAAQLPNQAPATTDQNGSWNNSGTFPAPTDQWNGWWFEWAKIGTTFTNPIYFVVGQPPLRPAMGASGNNFSLNDTYAISIIGARPNSPVSICAMQLGTDGTLKDDGCTPANQLSTPQAATTDQSGNWFASGSFPAPTNQWVGWWFEWAKIGSTSFSYNWTKELHYGMYHDPDVTALQQALTLEGVYTGPITGNYFDLTKAGVVAFQQKYNIVYNQLDYDRGNIVGQQTLAKLNQLY